TACTAFISSRCPANKCSERRYEGTYGLRANYVLTENHVLKRTLTFLVENYLSEILSLARELCSREKTYLLGKELPVRNNPLSEKEICSREETLPPQERTTCQKYSL